MNYILSCTDKFYRPVVESLMRRWPGFTRKAVFKVLCFICERLNRPDSKLVPTADHALEDSSRCLSNINAFGLRFSSAIGIAAGFDRNGKIGRKISVLGFGFMEIGTLSVSGEGDRNLAVLKTLFSRKDSDIGRLGISVGRDSKKPLSEGIEDYIKGVKAAWSLADYIAINLSEDVKNSWSSMAGKEEIEHCLRELKSIQFQLTKQRLRYVPIVLKLKMPEQPESLKLLWDLIRALKFDGVIAAEDGGKSSPRFTSRLPAERLQLQEQICARLGYLKQQLGNAVDVVSVGAVLDVNEANMRLKAGASLVQVHNALVYRGPSLISELKQCKYA